MKVGTETKTLIPSTAKLISSKNTFIGASADGKSVKLHVEDSFDINGDGKADIQRRRVLDGITNLLQGDLKSGGKLVSQSFTFTDESGQLTMAEDSKAAGKLDSVLTFDLNKGTVTGEKDLNGDFVADEKVEMVGGKAQISTSSRKDGQFDRVETPVGGFGW